MGANKLFWCNNCQTFEAVENADEVINRPSNWTRVEIQRAAGLEVLHYCPACAEKIREALAIFFKRRPQ